MDNWRLLNDLRKSVYCGKGGNHREKLEELVYLASKSNDEDLLKSALLLEKEIESVSTKQKILWLTSTVNGNFYPPLEVDLAGPVPWEGTHLLEPGSKNMESKYPNRAPLKVEETSELLQCKDIDDCSFIATLICMRVENVDRPRVRQIAKNLYVVELHFNGSKRLVTVDTSKIPTDTDGKQLSMHSSDIVDKIVELAYLQVKAQSYETSGSNCAVDAFRLVGFLPEILDARDCDVKQLIRYFQSGLCLIALGTGPGVSKASEFLVGNHDYPVVAVGKTSECLVIQDPLNPALHFEVNGDNLRRHYEQVYISWCHSKLFAYKTSLHFFYNGENCNRFNSIVDKPTFILDNHSKIKEPVQILLETHLEGSCNSTSGTAYLKQLREDVLLDNSSTPDGATNIRLQLSKYELSPGQKIRLFCHSSKSSTFSIHAFSNSQQLTIMREAKRLEVSSIEFEPNFSATTDSCDYFRNPTMMLRVESPISQEISVHLQLMSESPKDMINLQVYALNDHTLKRPMVTLARYEGQKCDIRDLALISNTSYKVVCSSYATPISSKFKLLATPSISSSHARITFNQIYQEFGGLPYHVEKTLEWSEDTNRIKVRLLSKNNNRCFIRIVPQVLPPLLSIRCNVYDGETHQQICKTNDFLKPGLAGVVIDQLEIVDCSDIVLLIEKDDPKIQGKVLASLPFKLLIGSQSKLSLKD
ncbi:Rim13p TDEL_0G02970 [Torulaspora delbrueckii]|uniref:Cysteine protease RIM13 n=1 Tax=Torulaspora delbrueckii TaxID=4950 RepID=G8ZXP7_TORDE|nr:hypothetical protein TDEL_0G02970 [Torulaspora delbrueckii]CCE93664.1 hypothetical protein TDEL_0G02970 [Torulaspora delbrueckii]